MVGGDRSDLADQGQGAASVGDGHVPVVREDRHPAGRRTLRVEFAGTKIEVLLDGKRYIDFEDSHISTPGAVGVWTKADSVTAFDGFEYGTGPR